MNQLSMKLQLSQLELKLLILDLILKPFVSSSKNLMRPPLDAGSGAALSAIMIQKNKF